jgi:hypothetical protein
MVAYGVLEMKHKAPKELDWTGIFQPQDAAQIEKDNFERDQLRKLVNDELRRYGLLLSRVVVANGLKFRTIANTHILYGQVYGPSNNPGFMARSVLCEGSFKECCEVAAKLLDQLDASQVPDKET